MSQEDEYSEYQWTDDQRIIDNAGTAHHPQEDIEPIFVEESVNRRFYRLLNQLVCHIIDHENPKQGAYVVGLCSDAFVIQDRSMEDIANELTVTRQAISKEFKSLCRQTGLLPERMKSDKAVQKYRKKRIAVVESSKEETNQAENN